ncbi:MAG TPA: HTTM domain-containing protein, partial [Polyangiaceae bacterium]|nr:HTTM domain-containing protein [Polyangiaceae bacterium]
MGAAPHPAAPATIGATEARRPPRAGAPTDSLRSPPAADAAPAARAGAPERSAPRSALARLANAAARPVDLAWLAAFRALFGLTMSVSMLRFLAYGWVDEFFVKPRFHFKYWGFAWVEPLSPPLLHAAFWALAGLGLAVAAGACFRLSAALLALGLVYVQLLDVATYLNHYYLAALLAALLALSPAHRAWSLDARAGLARPARTGPAFWLYLFRFQAAVVYSFAALAKAQGDWLLHAQPLRIWLGSKTDLPLLGPLFRAPGAPLALSWAGFLFDASIAWLLLARRSRPFAYAALLAFHALTRVLFPIGMFPVIMSLAALAFFPPSWPRDLARRALGFARRAVLPGSPALAAPAATEPAPAAEALARAAPGATKPAPAAPATAGPDVPAPGRFALALAGLYCVAQLLLPLRFLAYGGDVRWHEQGMRFSWRVMVREKNGSVTFLVRDPASGRVWHVDPRDYLTRLQEREMAAQPDLILQLAHHVRDDFARRGRGARRRPRLAQRPKARAAHRPERRSRRRARRPRPRYLDR